MSSTALRRTNDPLPMSAAEGRAWADMIEELCGLHLEPDKDYLLRQRLTPLAREYGFGSLGGLLDCLRRDPHREVGARAVEVMTTHETSFFRDRDPFDAFAASALPAFDESIRDRKRFDPAAEVEPVRIWCAACSTGQEPYSLALLIREWMRAHPSVLVRAEDFSILGADICAQSLARAETGYYREVELARGLPRDLLDRYFRPEGRGRRLVNEVREMVRFRRLNLLDGCEHLGRFEMIWCRNVLIYMERRRREEVLRRLVERLCPGGLLVLGCTETPGVDNLLEPVAVGEATFYRVPGRG